jgi:hypothetical protein
VQRLLAWAKGKGKRGIRRRYSQRSAWYFVAEHGTGIHRITMVLGPYAPDAQPARLSVCSHYFKRLESFPKLATSSNRLPHP